MSAHHVISGLSPEPLSASGRSSEKLSLPLLQSKMKCDPDGYEAELTLIYKQFNSALDLFRQQAALNFGSISGIGSDPNVAKDLGDRAVFLSHVMPFYRKQLAEFPSQLAEFLRSSAPTLPSGLRYHVTQALILLVNRQVFCRMRDIVIPEKDTFFIYHMVVVDALCRNCYCYCFVFG